MTQPPPPGWVPPGYQQPSPQWHQGPPGYQPYGYPPPFAPFEPPKPGCVPLRPLGVGDILDGAFRALRRNPKVMLGLSAPFAVVEAVISTAVAGVALNGIGGIDTADPNASLSPLLGADALQLVGFVVTALIGAVLTGMLTLVVTQDVLGKRPTAGEVWNQIRPRMWVVVGLAMTTGILEFLGLIPCLVIGVWLWGIWAVAMPACVVERLGIGAALGRSKRLVDRTFWRVWGIRALGTLVVSFAASIITVPFSIFGMVQIFQNFPNGMTGVSTTALILMGIGTLIGRTVTAPVTAAIDALLYVDLRMRKEGLDIALQHAASGPAAPLTAG